MLTWIWKDQPDDKDRFYAEYDYDYATLSSDLLRGPEPIPENVGIAVLSAKRYSSEQILKYGCLPAASNERVIHKRLAPALLSALGENEVQLFPVSVIAKRGERLEEHFAVVPLSRELCTDVARSDITGWIAPHLPGATANQFRSLKHIDGCLGSLNITRDKVTNLVVVSDKLKRALETTQEPGLCFSAPENMRSYFT
jgi:hypothetical protein